MPGAVVRRWVPAEVDEARARALCRDLNVSPLVSRLLVARGLHEPGAAARYLEPQLTHLPDPFLLRDMARAAARLADAIQRREAITLYGDYDVDGVTSTALLAAFVAHHGAEASIYLPKRLVEGYGLNPDAVDHLAARGTRLLVTLDCGITAGDEIARANGHGIETLVVDHHRCPPELPPAFATLNPHQDGCAYPDKVLAAVGVCFNLVMATRKVLRERGAYAAQPEPNLRRMMDLVALGTIADMVPLTGANRVLARFGLEILRRTDRPGLIALKDVSLMKPGVVTASDVGFRLGPRINAAGRLADATVGVQLLLTDDPVEARRLADVLQAANGQRQRIEADVFRDAVARVDAWSSLPAAIVLADEAWHPGVVGIVCSKLVERYDRPVVLIGEGGRGSARTARGVHLYDAIAACADHLTKFGGHRAAAGLRMSLARVDAFRAALDAAVRADPDHGSATESILRYDELVEPEALDLQLVSALERLEPFGNGNPEPLFRVRGSTVRSSRLVGNGEHLKLRLTEGADGGLEAIAFKRKDLLEAASPGRAVELAGHLERNDFGGVQGVSLRLRDLRPAPG